MRAATTGHNGQRGARSTPASDDERDAADRRAARRTADRLRAAFLADRFERIPQATLAFLGLTTLLHRANTNETKYACRLLGIEPVVTTTRYGVEHAYRHPLAHRAARSAKDLALVAGAIAAAMAEYRMGEYSVYDGMVGANLQVLVDAVYHLTDFERAELDRAAAWRDGDDGADPEALDEGDNEA